MKKAILLLSVFLFAFNLTTGKDLKSVNSSLDSQKTIDIKSQNFCTQQQLHTESNLWLSISNYGVFTQFVPSWPDNGLDTWPCAEFPAGSDLEYLFLGAVWVGGIVEGETLVSVGADGWLLEYEMFPDSCPEGGIKKFEEFGDQEFLAVYNDRFIDTGYDDPYDLRHHKPLNIEITQHSYSWISPPYNDFVLLDYTVRNYGDKFISKAYIGFYMDADIYHISNGQGYRDDITGHTEKTIGLPEGIKKIDLAWAADNNGDLVKGQITPRSPIGVFGFRLLDSPNPEAQISYNWWVSEGSDPVNLDFGPWKKSNWDLWSNTYGMWCEGGKGTPCGDRAKYFLMSNGEFDYDQIYTCIDQSDSGWLPPPAICADLADGYDTKFLYSFGPFDIPAKDSISFAVGIIMGDSLHRGENLFDNQNPQTYYSNLNFNDLFLNAIMAQRVYESGYILPPAGPPRDIKVLNSPDSILLMSWSPKKHYNLKGYNIYRSPTPGEYPDSPINSEVVKDTFYLDKGLVEGETYYYTIVSVDETGKSGKRSRELEVIAGKPMPPTGLVAVSDNKEICLTWKPHPEKDVVGYKIYRKEEGKEYEFIAGIGLSGLDTNFCDKNIEDGVVYYYAISAVDRKGLESFLSNSVSAYIMAFDQGILLVDMSDPYGRVFVQDESVNAFYNRVLQGYPFVYAKHDLPAISYIPLKELSPYPVCIIHSEGRYGPDYISFKNTVDNLKLYLKAGGKLVLIGKNIIRYPYSEWEIINSFSKGDFAYDILHLQSIFYPIWGCGLQEFIGTHSTLLSEFSDLEVDTARVNLCYPKDECDLRGKLPLIGYFVPLYPEEVIYNFNSSFDTSDFEGKSIGMRHIGDDYQVYFFDFPLYYIKEEQSIPMLHKILKEFGFSPTDVDEEFLGIPEGFSLGRNYPNPFNPTTNIPFTVSGSQLIIHSSSHTTLKIYNILGQLVRTLVDEDKLPGRYNVVWDGKDNYGKEVSSGIYFYQLITKNYTDTKKMVLLR
jgi:hypothetical protein